MKERVSLLNIFLLMLKISTFTFGGGFVMVSMLQKECEKKRGWVSDTELEDIAVIAQSAPGSVGVNAAIMLGYSLRGLPGVAASLLGTICPPLVILSVISAFYVQFSEAVLVAAALEGMRAGVAAIVFDVALSMVSKVIAEHRVARTGTMITAFVAAAVLDVSCLIIIGACVLAGVLRIIMTHFDTRRMRKVSGE